MIQALPPAGGVDSAERSVHHANHRGLLDGHAQPVARASIDAVIVPSYRQAAAMAAAAALAADLVCPLIALCSQSAEAAAVREVARGAVAVDVASPSALPPLLTTARLAGTSFARSSDTALKRNIGLAITRMTGWQNVLFLDDDITGVQADSLQRAASLLDSHDVVGLQNLGFPDNSVVCHANRDTGGHQGTFVGAGAMLFRGGRVTSFFPHVYNEDWFFLLDGERLVNVAVHGTFAQARYDPYANPTRAGSEEFGDCLAEGIFSLLDDGGTTADADREFWVRFLTDRAALIETIKGRLPAATVSAFRRTQIAESLKAARARLLEITPKLCVDYLGAWRHDRDTWRDWMELLPKDLSAEEALSHLGVGC
ncbi:MAG TPA: hypothetical protein VGQ92_28680 [Actinoplanes sp.]|jgi:hypothetical protein|nr:hypothetical protein [Actinoplanes sp.]